LLVLITNTKKQLKL